jgi:hypothetical protein
MSVVRSLPPGSGKLVGTVDYVAPEEIRGEEVDGRAGRRVREPHN